MQEAELQEAQIEGETSDEVVEKFPLMDFVEFDVVDSFNDLESEINLIESVETIQDYDKMYQFVNEDIPFEELEGYANKCLQYITPSNRDYDKVARRAGEIKSKPILVEDSELDFI